ncbi:hypothetical protein BV898_03831 [Hypsibius exemplaris]|uniref:Uncharacterized protein n=1 Tax=Hypsibius exemplaris TaxID=2072580 RepID=A0A1W0X4C9_HYPEX|nr:hypothetical protein BV898_03831 [Hypsibius exemplaris]
MLRDSSFYLLLVIPPSTGIGGRSTPALIDASQWSFVIHTERFRVAEFFFDWLQPRPGCEMFRLAVEAREGCDQRLRSGRASCLPACLRSASRNIFLYPNEAQSGDYSLPPRKNGPRLWPSFSADLDIFLTVLKSISYDWTAVCFEGFWASFIAGFLASSDPFLFVHIAGVAKGGLQPSLSTWTGIELGAWDLACRLLVPCCDEIHAAVSRSAFPSCLESERNSRILRSHVSEKSQRILLTASSCVNHLVCRKDDV